MASELSDAELLARLVAFDTTSHLSNLPIADFICDYLDHERISVARNFSDDGAKVNFILRASASGGAEESRLGLCLSGHLDTVPALEPGWENDPFQLIERDDRYIARGACDMKGFVALAVNLMREAVHRPLKHPLVLILSYDEEPGILGAQHLARTWQRPFALPKAVVVGEPTELRVVRMHKGHLKMRVIFQGKTAHTGYAHLGINAIEPAGRAIVALSLLNEDFKALRSAASEYFPETPHPTLTITRIHGGTATNVVPDSCVLDLGLRLLPDMNPAEWEQRVCHCLVQLPNLGSHSIEVSGLSAPFMTEAASPIHQTLCDLTSQKETFAVSYASDAGPLQSMGLDCVLFGPGSIEVAHKPNEWMPKAEFVAARGILSRLVERCCLS